MSKKRRFNYARRSTDQVKRRSSQSGTNFDSPIREDINTFSPKNEGDYNLRIMPPTWEEPEHFGFDAFIHYGVGADNQAYACPNEMNNDPCPICEARTQAEREGESDYAKELKPTKRVAVYVIDRDNEDEGPQLWTMPWTFDRDLAELMIDKTSGEVLMIDDPDEGYDIAFTREGTGLNTVYKGKQISRRSSPLHEDEKKVETWLDFVEENPIPDVFNFYSYQHMAKVFEGQAAPSNDSDDDDEEEEERGSFRSRRRSKEDDEEEDNPLPPEGGEEEDDGDEEEEEEQPRRRRRTRGTRDKLKDVED